VTQTQHEKWDEGASGCEREGGVVGVAKDGESD
jgi:hypothetical protein